MTKSEEMWRKQQELLKRSFLRTRLEKNLYSPINKRIIRTIREYGAGPQESNKEVGKAEPFQPPVVYQGPLAHNPRAGKGPQYASRAPRPMMSRDMKRAIMSKEGMSTRGDQRGLIRKKNVPMLKEINRRAGQKFGTAEAAYKMFAKMGVYAPKTMNSLLGSGRGGGAGMKKAYGRVRSGYKDIR